MLYHGERVRLRPPERKDLPQFVTWLSNPELRAYITVRYISEALEERWFERLLDKTGGGAPLPIGVISLMDINWRDRDAEAGVVIGDPQYWGQGYGTDAMLTLLQVGFRWYNLHRIYLRVVTDNARAVRSYEKVGFQHEGTLREAAFVNGVYRDLLLMSVLDREYEGVPE